MNLASRLTRAGVAVLAAMNPAMPMMSPQQARMLNRIPGVNIPVAQPGMLPAQAVATAQAVPIGYGYGMAPATAPVTSTIVPMDGLHENLLMPMAPVTAIAVPIPSAPPLSDTAAWN
jgi:hypothetical protein